MALEEYVGAIVLEVGTTEVEVIDLSVTVKTGKKIVKTMNRTGKPRGFTKGVQEIDLDISVVIPLSGDLDWKSIQGAKITVFPVSEGGKRMSYRDCVVTEVGHKYTVENEAHRSLKVVAMDEVEE
ncbi:hypothetical protein [Chitinibacter sp. ZOR0017]|uniref:hypothetical protein n=1 Tax=Chitinibacter sp. ZOR0017 TaxID=1339254 RepID=UPI00064651B5|nr:hypothetical protein [Chitinibacter sp. ZOR0017]